MKKRKIIAVIVTFILLVALGMTYLFMRLQSDVGDSLEVALFTVGEDTVDESYEVGDSETVSESYEVSNAETSSGTKEIWYVYISGAVNHPGVYQVAPQSRLFQVIIMAGGLNAEAEERLINQAEYVADGQHIDIPKKGEDSSVSVGDAESLIGSMSASGGPYTDGKVDINMASKEELMTLPGIGEAKAEAILDYREKNGAFTSVEDILKVSGIKEAVYEKIRDKIKVL